MNNQQIRNAAPAVFSEQPSPLLSQRYAFINTSEVIEVMRGEGYEVVSATQDKAMRRDARYIRHAVVMRHQEHLQTEAQVGECVPQILLTNSHNGTTKMEMRAGLFRFVCANGLVVGQETMHAVIRHTGILADQVISHARIVSSRSGGLMTLIENWKNIEVSVDQAETFALAAAELRFGDAAVNYKPSDLLSVRRDEDDSMNFWTVFNRVQENTTKAGLPGLSSAKRITKTKDLAGIGFATSYNEKLWALGESMVAH